MIEELATDIERAIKGGAWTAALAAALALPDICAALGSDDGETSGPRYRRWWEAEMGPTYSTFAGDAYSLRCGILHQGRDRGRIGLKNYTRVFFALPNPQGAVAHGNIFNGALNFDLATFCRDIARAARRWHGEHDGDANVMQNRKSLVRWRPEGLPPFISGISVLA